MTTSQLLTHLAEASCPAWCTLPAGHDYPTEDVGDQMRLHAMSLATWTSGERRAFVEIEMLAHAESETAATERLDKPLINLYVEPADGLGNLTAEQARELAAFLAVSLRAAADRLETLR
jgi:hypothetical protein